MLQTVLHLLISCVLVLGGLFVALADDVAPDMHVFGWVLVVIGLFGVASAVLLQQRRR